MPPTACGVAENIGIGVGSGGFRLQNADCVPEMKSTQKAVPMRCFSASEKGFAVRCGDADGGIGAVGIGIGVFRPKIADPVAKMNSTRDFTLWRLSYVPPSKIQGSAEIPTEVGVGIGVF